MLSIMCEYPFVLSTAKCCSVAFTCSDSVLNHAHQFFPPGPHIFSLATSFLLLLPTPPPPHILSLYTVVSITSTAHQSLLLLYTLALFASIICLVICLLHAHICTLLHHDFDCLIALRRTCGRSKYFVCVDPAFVCCKCYSIFHRRLP